MKMTTLCDDCQFHKKYTRDSCEIYLRDSNYCRKILSRYHACMLFLIATISRVIVILTISTASFKPRPT